MYPLARTAELIVEDLASETIIYDAKNHRAHCLNQTASLIWKHCDGQTEVGEISHRLSKATGLPLSAEIVNLGLRELGACGLLVEPRSSVAQPSRRKIITNLALAGSAAVTLLPAITSVVAPTPAMAASGQNGNNNNNNNGNNNNGNNNKQR